MKSHQTYEIALSAKDNGNHPFGALLVVDGEMILSAENTVNTEHAELNLVSLATRQLDKASLAKAILYTSTEPCAMCSGAIFWAGISTVVYGCSTEKLAEMATGSFVVPCKDVFEYGTRKTTVLGPILETEGAEVHRGFWP